MILLEFKILRKNHGELPALDQCMTQSYILSSRSPSSVGMTWGSWTAPCLWILQHFYVAASPGSPVCSALAAMWSHMHHMGCYRPQGPLGCRAAMGSSKAMPKMRQFNPASPAGAFLTCPWFSLWVCGHFLTAGLGSWPCHQECSPWER